MADFSLYPFWGVATSLQGIRQAAEELGLCVGTVEHHSDVGHFVEGLVGNELDGVDGVAAELRLIAFQLDGAGVGVVINK